MRAFLTGWMALTATVGISAGCAAEGDPVDALCAAEKFNCEDHYDGFVRPDRCKVEGELTADLGFGEHGFEVLPDGELPPIHLGSQGGMHVFMALRIFGADLTQYDTIRVHFAFTHELASGECAGGARGTGGQECALIQGKRDLVLGAKQPITVLADGTIEEHGILVFMDAVPAGNWRVLLQVEDGCKRIAEVERELLTTQTIQRIED